MLEFHFRSSRCFQEAWRPHIFNVTSNHLFAALYTQNVHLQVDVVKSPASVSPTIKARSFIPRKCKRCAPQTYFVTTLSSYMRKFAVLMLWSKSWSSFIKVGHPCAACHCALQCYCTVQEEQHGKNIKMFKKEFLWLTVISFYTAAADVCVFPLLRLWFILIVFRGTSLGRSHYSPHEWRLSSSRQHT